jgi:hypothetical protein
VINTLGSGKTLLSAYPLETYLAALPFAFEKPEHTHRIYDAFREWTGVKPPFRSNHTSVEVTSLMGKQRGYAFVINHSSEAHKVIISSALPLKSVSRLTPDKSVALSIQNASWELDLEPYEVAVVEWK